MKLDKNKAPVLFLSVGGDRPEQLEPKLLKKQVKYHEIGVLASTVQQKLASRFSVMSLTSAAQMKKKCIDLIPSMYRYIPHYYKQAGRLK